MKIFLHIKKYAPVIVALVIIWLSSISFSILFNRANKNQLEMVPPDNNFVFKLNFKDFLKSTTYSMIFKSKDQKLLNTFRDFLSKQRKGTGKSNDFGINYFSDVLIYGQKYKEGQLYVMLVNLVNQNKFRKNLPHYLNENQALSIRNRVGLIATYFGEKKVSKTELAAYLDKLNKQKPFDYYQMTDNEFFHVKLDDYYINEKFQIDKGYFYTNLTDNELLLRGSVALRSDFERPKKWTLKEEFALRPFHIESSFVSSSFQDTMKSYFSKVGLDIPGVNGLAFNYYGLEIQETELGLIFTPKFDLILNFEKKVSRDGIFKDKERLMKFGFDFKGSYLKAGNIHYAIELLDSSTLFIGCNRDLVTKKKNYLLLKISGDLDKITEISGGGFVKSIINVIPPYKASKDFFATIKEYKLSLSPKSNRLLFLRGNIKLRDNYYLYNEFLKFYLTLKGNY